MGNSISTFTPGKEIRHYKSLVYDTASTNTSAPNTTSDKFLKNSQPGIRAQPVTAHPPTSNRLWSQGQK